MFIFILSGCDLANGNANKIINSQCLFARSFEVQIRNGVVYSENVPIPIGFIEQIAKNKVMFTREYDSEVKRYILEVTKDKNIYIVGINDLEFFRCR